VVFNFSWVVEDKVGGMARPTKHGLEWLRDRGVTAVVSLTERAPETIDELEMFRVPIRDMTPPTLDQLHAMVEFMRRVVNEGGKVVAHCEAGMGRTGTVLAAFLVGEGWSGREAIERVREMRPGSIETRAQEQVIHQYAELLGDVC
jgi:atypical dual specificity phosphatase